MQSWIYPRRLTGSRRACLLALAVVVFGAPTAVIRGGATGAATTTIPLPSSTLYCLDDPCYSPQQIQVAYGIQPLLKRGINGRGETVTAVVPVPVPSQGPSDIRQDLAAFDGRFHLPAAPIEVVTSLVPSASRWQATGEEVGDLEILHAVAPGATLRVVLFPSFWNKSPANATADMLAVLPLVVSHTDVASISWGLGSHYFTLAQVAKMHSILLGAKARHVTVVASSGDNGVYPTDWGWGGRQVKGVELPSSDPLVLSVGGTQLDRESQDRRLHRRDRLERFGWRLQPPIRPPHLSRSRAGDLQDERRARRGRRRRCARRHGAGLHLGWQGVPHNGIRHERFRAALGRNHGAGR